MDLRDLAGIAGSKGVVGAINSIPGYIDEYVPGYKDATVVVKDLVDDALQQTKDQYGEMRKAGMILKTNPAGVVLTELIFPPAAAGGELTEALRKFGPEAVNRNPSPTYDPTL